MHFVLYTDKTVPQCVAALNERLQAKAVRGRPEMKGVVQRNGQFILSATSGAFLGIKRTTRLQGAAQREAGTTVIKGFVSDGVTPFWQRVTVAILILICVFLVLIKELVFAALVMFLGGAALVPMVGDYKNSEYLLIEIEKILKASPKPPRKPAPQTAAKKPR